MAISGKGLSILRGHWSTNGSRLTYKIQGFSDRDDTERVVWTDWFFGGAGAPQTYFQSLSSILTPSGIHLKSTTKTTAGSLTVSAILVPMILYTKAIGGSITMAGVITRQISKRVSGVTTLAGSVIKRTTKTLSGTTTLSGIVLKRTARGLGAILTPSGSLGIGLVLTRVYTATVQAAGSLTQTYIPWLPPVARKVTNNLYFLRRFIGRR